MTQFETITELKNGIIKIEFSILRIYSILKDNLGFCYVKYNNKGYYLRNEYGNYKVIKFYELIDTFTNFIKTEYITTTSKEELLDAYYRQAPIKNGNAAKQCLKTDYLSDEKIQEMLMIYSNTK